MRRRNRKFFSLWTDLSRFFPFTELANVYTTETGMGTGKSAFENMLSHCDNKVGEDVCVSCPTINANPYCI